jgi:hypothetical protein
MTGSESSIYLPPERVDDRLSLVIPTGRMDLVAQLICGGLVAYDNGPVYAIVGNAGNSNLQEQIRLAKGEDRHGPVGATMPFDEPLIEGIFRTSHLTDAKDIALRDFLEDPDALTRRLGGLAFIRTPADPDKRATLPDGMFPESTADKDASDEADVTIQVYSPVGNAVTDSLLRRVLMKGGVPVMTSLNPHGTPEIITEAGARQFSAARGLHLAINGSEATKPLRGRASYPIVDIRLNEAERRQEIGVPRTGFMDIDILVALLDGLPIADIDRAKLSLPKYPDNVLRRQDLPEPAQTAKGEELRKYLLQALRLDQ